MQADEATSSTVQEEASLDPEFSIGEKGIFPEKHEKCGNSDVLNLRSDQERTKIMEKE